MASSSQGQQGGQQGRSGRGFASMDPERQREIASQGGKAAHEKGTAHEFTPEEAREAGSKGGAALAAGQRADFDGHEAIAKVAVGVEFARRPAPDGRVVAVDGVGDERRGDIRGRTVGREHCY